MLSIKLGFDWPSGFREEFFQYFCNIDVYCPGLGANQSLGSNYFQNYLPSVHMPISCKICLSNDILTIFPIQMRGQPMLTLP